MIWESEWLEYSKISRWMNWFISTDTITETPNKFTANNYFKAEMFEIRASRWSNLVKRSETENQAGFLPFGARYSSREREREREKERESAAFPMTRPVPAYPFHFHVQQLATAFVRRFNRRERRIGRFIVRSAWIFHRETDGACVSRETFVHRNGGKFAHARAWVAHAGYAARRRIDREHSVE